MPLKHKPFSILSSFFIVTLLAFPYFSQAWSFPDWMIWKNKNSQEKSQKIQEINRLKKIIGIDRERERTLKKNNPQHFCVKNPDHPQCTVLSGEDDAEKTYPPYLVEEPYDEGTPLRSNRQSSDGGSLPSVSTGDHIPPPAYPDEGYHRPRKKRHSGRHTDRLRIPNKSCRSGKYRSISEAAQALGKNQGSISCRTQNSAGGSGTLDDGNENTETFGGSNYYWSIRCHVSCSPQKELYRPGTTEVDKDKDKDNCVRLDNHGNFLCSFYKDRSDNCSVSCTPTEWDARTLYSSEEVSTHKSPRVDCSYSNGGGRCQYKSIDNEKCRVRCWQRKNDVVEEPKYNEPSSSSKGIR